MNQIVWVLMKSIMGIQCSPQSKIKAYWKGIFWVELVSTSCMQHNPRYIELRSTIILMHELMFQAGVKGMSERSELIPCIY